jgi:hypothetical protein
VSRIFSVPAKNMAWKLAKVSSRTVSLAEKSSRPSGAPSFPQYPVSDQSQKKCIFLKSVNVTCQIGLDTFKQPCDPANVTQFVLLPSTAPPCRSQRVETGILPEDSPKKPAIIAFQYLK